MTDASVVRVVERIHYLDNLRALAMMLGVLLHGAFAYAHPAQSFWLATDPSSSVIVDASIWFIHLFRMSLFYLLSGYFANMMVARKGLKPFLWNRVVRLVIPFIIFFPFLLVMMSLVIGFGLYYVPEPKGLMGLILASIRQPNPASTNSQPITTMHLWFLYYLILFSMLGGLASLIRFPAQRIFALLTRWWFVAPLLLLPGVYEAGVPIKSPESFIPTWWPIAFYGVFYWLGWQLWGNDQLLDRCEPYAWHLLVVCGVLFVPYYWSLPVLDLNAIVQETSVATTSQGNAYLLGCVLTSYLSVGLTVTALLFGKKYLTQRNGFLRFVSDAAYWVYLIHLPIAMFLQTLLIPAPINMWLKLAIVLLGTLLACFATYVVFVRYTPVGWLLNGKRSFP